MTTRNQEELPAHSTEPAAHPEGANECPAHGCAAFASPPAPSAAARLAAGLSPTRQNYLKYIYLEEQAQGYARACKLSEALGVTRSTVALTFRDLKARGFITYERYSPIRLTEKGRAIAAELVRKNKIIKHFFSSVLDLDDKMSERIACELEHVISEAVLGRLTRFESHIALHQSFWRQHEGSEADEAAAGHPGTPAGHPEERRGVLTPGHHAMGPVEGA